MKRKQYYQHIEIGRDGVPMVAGTTTKVVEIVQESIAIRHELLPINDVAEWCRYLRVTLGVTNIPDDLAKPSVIRG